jgi:putative photosynthetic complex assembly protein
MYVSAADRAKAGPVIVTPAALLGAAALLFVVVGAAVAHSWTAEGPAPAPVVRARTLLFEDRADGAVVVVNAADRRVVDVARGQQGFLRQTLRGLALARAVDGPLAGAPFTLTYYADHRLILLDPLTRRQVELEAFGPANAGVFARFLE